MRKIVFVCFVAVNLGFLNLSFALGANSTTDANLKLASIENNTSCDCGDFKSQDEINKFFGVKSDGNSNSNSGEN